MKDEKNELSQVVKTYLFETRSLAKNLEELPQNVQENLNYLKKNINAFIVFAEMRIFFDEFQELTLIFAA